MTEEARGEKALHAERNIAFVRLAVIVFNIAVYALYFRQQDTIVPLAVVVAIVAYFYALFVVIFEPYRRVQVLATSYFTALTDGLLILLWITATGGFDSPFYPLWYVSLVAVAFRFDSTATFFTALLYANAYLALLLAMGEFLENTMVVLVRVGYILLIGLLGGLIARETTLEVRRRIHMRDRAEAAEALEQRFRLLSDAALEGICLHKDGSILEANQTFDEIVGNPRGRSIGQHVMDFVDPESRADVEARLQEPVDAPYEVWLRRRDGERVRVQVNGRDIPYRDEIVRVVSVRDITDQYERARAEKLAYQRQLEVEKLQEVNRMKTQLLNVASHELNTPITPMQLQLFLIRSEKLGGLSDKQRKAVDVLDRNVSRLAKLVGDVLDVARLQSSQLKLRPERVRLGGIFDEVVSTFKHSAGEGSIELVRDTDDELVVFADAHRVTQVLFNMISNAIKFTPPGGTVRLGAARRGEELHVEVEDDGIGISEDDQRRLFQPFSQVEPDGPERKSGTGLGLYISRGIVEEHGGRMWCHSDGHGKGSTFAFTIPIGEPSAEEE